MSATGITLFYSYSHKDEELRKQLEDHLSVLRRNRVIQGWHDRKITAGDDWRNEISQHLESAQIILLLVSSHFLASDYCYDVEMSRALARDKAGEAKTIPIILRDCDWSEAPFARLKALPKDGRAVTSRFWKNTHEAFTDVARGLRDAIREYANQAAIPASEESREVSAANSPHDDTPSRLAQTASKMQHVLRAATDATIASLEALDPRFRVELTTKGSQLHFNLHATEPVSFQLRLKGPQAGKRTKDLIEKGLPVNLVPDEIELLGSPLLEHAFKSIQSIQTAHQASGTLSIERIGENGKVLAGLDAIPCTYIGGTKEVRAEAQLEQGLFRCLVKFSKKRKIPVTLGINLSRWFGERLSRLPHFESLNSVFGHLTATDELRLTLFHPGFRLGDGKLVRLEKALRDLSNLLLMFERMRVVARQFRIDPAVPAAITPKARSEVAMLFKLLRGEEVHLNPNGVELDITIEKELLDAFINSKEPGDFDAPHPGDFDFLSEKVRLENVRLRATKVVPALGKEQLIALKNAFDQQVTITLKPTAATDVVLIPSGAVNQ